MKKKLQPAITLLQQYMAQDMTVYAGHATLFLLTAFFPLLMWLLVVVNTLPGFTVDSVVELFFRFLPDIPVIRDTIAGLITSMNENSNTFVASLAVITTLVSASSGMAAIQKGLQKLTPGSRRTMLDRLWAVVYTFAFLWLLLIVLGVILVYYIAATLLPVDKIIGRIYPVFGFALLFMAVGILVVLLFGGEYTIPEFTSFENCIADAKAFPIVPMLFTTIACGAISGFHATQSPLMARCMRSESESRSVFYGAMISESIIALVWAAIAMAFWGDVAGLNGAIAEYGGQAAVMIDVIANKTLGPALAVFVIFGVVACAITSGDTDTAFRSARLIVADFMGVEQRTLRKRIYICIPLFALGLLIIFGLPFQTMWSYFAWMNQTLAAVTLWMIVAYLRHRGRAVWVGLIPALVMTYVCASYIFVSPLMLGMQNRTAAYLLGGGVTLAVLVAMIFKLKDNDAKGIS